MDNSRVYAALVAGIIGIISSLITIYWIKPKIDNQFHLFKLDTNFKHSQAKKIRKAISRHKAKLIYSAELLNSRLRNFSKVHNKNWLDSSMEGHSDYYHNSMVYRFVSFYSYIQLIESGLQYLDTTNSMKSDLELVKYFRIFKDIFSDADLYGITYTEDLDKDTIFRNDIDRFANVLLNNGRVITYNEYLDDIDLYKSKLYRIYRYFDGISPAEKTRYRIENIKCLHCVLMSFLGFYGYDFHKTKYSKIEELSSMLGKLKHPNGLLKIISRYKLKLTQENLKLIISKYSS